MLIYLIVNEMKKKGAISLKNRQLYTLMTSTISTVTTCLVISMCIKFGIEIPSVSD